MPWDYPQALDFLSRFTDFERASTDRVRYRDFNLQRVSALLALLGNPHLGIPAVHVAGTKGKGSTVAMVASVLSAAGLRPGVFTSPHLHHVRERIVVGEASISEEEFAHVVEAMAPAVEEVHRTTEFLLLTWFELLTAAAFCHFRTAGTGLAVVEVGLGGRLDATNVLAPTVCGITNISRDHVDLLGDTLQAIAGEKAAIIKPGVPVVSSPQREEAMEVILRAAEACGSPVTRVGRDVTWDKGTSGLEGQTFRVATRDGNYDLRTPLLGEHQLENAATAVAICEVLRGNGIAIPDEAIQRGLASVRWPARLEVMSSRPLIVADGAHNGHSMTRVMESLEDCFEFDRLIVVFGTTRTKDLSAMVDAVAPRAAAVVATASAHPRAMAPGQVLQGFAKWGLVAETAPDVKSALDAALEKAGERDLVLVTGSLFVAAEAREIILGITPETHRWVVPAGV